MSPKAEKRLNTLLNIGPDRLTYYHFVTNWKPMLCRARRIGFSFSAVRLSESTAVGLIPFRQTVMLIYPGQ